MNLKYITLFSIEFLHDYYADGQCHDFEIVPTDHTKSVLTSYGMLCKAMGNRLFVLVRIDHADLPIASLNMLPKLAFYLKLTNRDFYNFSNLNDSLSGAKRYYFSNANQNKVDSALYLNSKPQVYNSGPSYLPGQFAMNGSNNVFEAIQASNPASAKPLTNSNFWLKRGKVQYVNENDLLELTSFNYDFETSAATSFTVKVFEEDVASGDYTKQVIDSTNLSFSEARSSVTVRLENLPSGKYRIEVNGSSKFVYYDSKALYSKVFGIVEISPLQPSSNSFSLLDASGKPKKSNFLIRFANRLTYWKYLTKTVDITAVKDSRSGPDKYSFSPAPGNQFVSEHLIPFAQKPINTLFLESAALGNISPLANPSPERLSQIEKDGQVYYCAEHYLNY